MIHVIKYKPTFKGEEIFWSGLIFGGCFGCIYQQTNTQFIQDWPWKCKYWLFIEFSDSKKDP